MRFIISFIFSAIIIVWFSQQASYIPVDNWVDALIYTGKSIVFFGLFSKSFGINLSIAFWVITILIYFMWIAAIQNRKEKNYQRSTSFICASCDQYLGTGEGYSVPCPRCGSNRYYTE